MKDPFYGGFFVWEGKKYRGTQAIFIDPAIFQRTQESLNSSHRPKPQRHEFAFSGLLTCAFDHCAVTAEIKKGRYVYYQCTGYRGKCALPYMREEAVGEQLSQILKNIHIPDEVLRPLQDSLEQDSKQICQESAAQRTRLEQRLAAVRRRIDQAYLDKLEGKISEEFWAQKNAEWQEEASGIMLALWALSTANPDRLLTANRILELANKPECGGAGQTAPNGAFELCYRRRKPLSSLQKAVRPATNRSARLLPWPRTSPHERWATVWVPPGSNPLADAANGASVAAECSVPI